MTAYAYKARYETVYGRTRRRGRPFGLFRFPVDGGTPSHLGKDGRWHDDPELYRYTLGGDIGADDIDAAEAERVERVLRAWLAANATA